MLVGRSRGFEIHSWETRQAWSSYCVRQLSIAVDVCVIQEHTVSSPVAGSVGLGT